MFAESFQLNHSVIGFLLVAPPGIRRGEDLQVVNDGHRPHSGLVGEGLAGVRDSACGNPAVSENLPVIEKIDVLTCSGHVLSCRLSELLRVVALSPLASLGGIEDLCRCP